MRIKRGSFQDCCHTDLACLPNKKCEESEVRRNHIFLQGLGGKLNLAGAFRFELKTSVLETGVLPIETTRL